MAADVEMAKAYYILYLYGVYSAQNMTRKRGNSDVKAKPRRADTFGPTHTSRDGNGSGNGIGDGDGVYIYIGPYPDVLPGLRNFRSALCYRAENVT